MRSHPTPPFNFPVFFDGDITVPLGSIDLPATLTIPRRASALVVFAHGGGSSKYSPTYRTVATGLNANGFATLLVDLLTDDEEAVDWSGARLRFDVYLLAERLKAVTKWAQRDGALEQLPIGYLGSGTGSAAAFMAAASLPSVVRAVVSKGGRPDMAAGALKRSRAAALLIAGDLDSGTREANDEAFSQLGCEKEMVVLPGASHLFQEEGALQTVEKLARNWFGKYLTVEQSSMNQAMLMTQTG